MHDFGRELTNPSLFAGMLSCIIVPKYLELSMEKVTTNDYYINAFRKLKREGKNSWNWSAAIFGATWLIYRKMYLYAFLFTLLDIFTILVVVTSLEYTVNSIHYINISDFENVYNYGTGIISVLFFGYYGNRLYYKTVKRKIAKGYHLLERHHPFSIIVCIVAATIVFSLVCWEEGLKSEVESYQLMGRYICADLLMLFVAACCAAADWLAKKYHKRKQKDTKSTAVSEENIRRYLMYSNRNHLPGQIAATICSVICLLLYTATMPPPNSAQKAENTATIAPEVSAQTSQNPPAESETKGNDAGVDNVAKISSNAETLNRSAEESVEKSAAE